MRSNGKGEEDVGKKINILVPRCGLRDLMYGRTTKSRGPLLQQLSSKFFLQLLSDAEKILFFFRWFWWLSHFFLLFFPFFIFIYISILLIIIIIL
jgi:hypothetical protein